MGWIKDKLKKLFGVRSPSKEWNDKVQEGLNEFYIGYNDFMSCYCELEPLCTKDFKEVYARNKEEVRCRELEIERLKREKFNKDVAKLFIEMQEKSNGYYIEEG